VWGEGFFAQGGVTVSGLRGKNHFNYGTRPAAVQTA